MELSDVLKNIVKTSKFPFKLHYVDNPFNQIIYGWMKKGKKLWHLIEPVDGFHPNQVGYENINQKLQPTIYTLFHSVNLPLSENILFPVIVT